MRFQKQLSASNQKYFWKKILREYLLFLSLFPRWWIVPTWSCSKSMRIMPMICFGSPKSWWNSRKGKYFGENPKEMAWHDELLPRNTPKAVWSMRHRFGSLYYEFGVLMAKFGYLMTFLLRSECLARVKIFILMLVPSAVFFFSRFRSSSFLLGCKNDLFKKQGFFQSKLKEFLVLLGDSDEVWIGWFGFARNHYIPLTFFGEVALSYPVWM